MLDQLIKLTTRQERINLRSVKTLTAAMVSGTKVTSQFRLLTGIQIEKIHQVTLGCWSYWECRIQLQECLVSHRQTDMGDLF